MVPLNQNGPLRGHLSFWLANFQWSTSEITSINVLKHDRVNDFDAFNKWFTFCGALVTHGVAAATRNCLWNLMGKHILAFIFAFAKRSKVTKLGRNNKMDNFNIWLNFDSTWLNKIAAGGHLSFWFSEFSIITSSETTGANNLKLSRVNYQCLLHDPPCVWLRWHSGWLWLMKPYVETCFGLYVYSSEGSGDQTWQK